MNVNYAKCGDRVVIWDNLSACKVYNQYREGINLIVRSAQLQPTLSKVVRQVYIQHQSSQRFCIILVNDMVSIFVSRFTYTHSAGLKWFCFGKSIESRKQLHHFW